MGKNILIVAAHPDDEVLGCAGTVIKLVQRGYNAFTLILGEGITSRYKKQGSVKNIRNKLSILKQQTLKADRLMGVKDTFFCGFADNRFDTLALLDIVNEIEEIKNRVKPEIIYTHFRDDLNLDHRVTFNAVLTACRPIQGESVKEIYSFEIPSSTEWNYPKAFAPNIFVDIADSIDAKMKAVSAYASELKKFPHPRSKVSILNMAKYWGCVSGLNYAEAFEAVRIIKGGKNAGKINY